MAKKPKTAFDFAQQSYGSKTKPTKPAREGIGWQDILLFPFAIPRYVMAYTQEKSLWSWFVLVSMFWVMGYWIVWAAFWLMILVTGSPHVPQAKLDGVALTFHNPLWPKFSILGHVNDEDFDLNIIGWTMLHVTAIPVGIVQLTAYILGNVEITKRLSDAQAGMVFQFLTEGSLGTDYWKMGFYGMFSLWIIMAIPVGLMAAAIWSIVQ